MEKEDIILYAKLMRKLNSDPFELSSVLSYKVAYIDVSKIFFSYICDNQKYIIFDNNFDMPRRRVICAHALGHLILNTESEYEANLFAVAYLFFKRRF